MKCDICHENIPQGESHEHAGKNLCDDCYMDEMQPATGCDPWAVYLATRTKNKDKSFSPIQRKILALVAEKGRVAIKELLDATGLDVKELQNEVVTLRHMEKVMWERMPNDNFVLKPFEG
ncbi:hypothetical protein ACFL2O_11480 [Thermodesulfobacteriota bacterium]